jgi:hypothetical protein
VACARLLAALALRCPEALPADTVLLLAERELQRLAPPSDGPPCAQEAMDGMVCFMSALRELIMGVKDLRLDHVRLVDVAIGALQCTGALPGWACMSVDAWCLGCQGVWASARRSATVQCVVAGHACLSIGAYMPVVVCCCGCISVIVWGCMPVVMCCFGCMPVIACCAVAACLLSCVAACLSGCRQLACLAVQRSLWCSDYSVMPCCIGLPTLGLPRSFAA